MRVPLHRFTPPWTVHDNGDAYFVKDATGARFAFTFYREPPLVGTGDDLRFRREEARRIAVNIARLPELLAKK